MTADLVARLESVADDVDPNKSPGRSHREIAAEIRSIARALRPSGEAVAWVAEFDDGWREYASPDDPEVQEWPTWRNPPVSIRPLIYGDPANGGQPPSCLECGASLLYECVACSSSNYPATPASAPDWNMAQHWIDRYAGGIDDELQLDRVAEALGLPDPTPPTSTKGG